MPSLGSRAISAALALRGSKKRLNDIDATLADIAARQLRPVPYGPPRRLDRKVDITISTVRGWQIYEIAPRTATAKQAALYLHGGAYVRQISHRQWKFVAKLAAATITRFTVPIFPLAPNGTAADVVPALTDVAAELMSSIGPERTIIVGDSSGGGMALAVALQLRDRHLPAPARTVLISPWLDVAVADPAVAAIAPRDVVLAAPGLKAAGDLYRGDLPADSPTVSPIHGDLTGLGPITLLSGTRDILQADARRLVDRAKSVGLSLDYHEATDMPHGYAMFPIAEGKRARAVIEAALGTRG